MASIGLATSLLRPFALDEYVRFVREAETRGYSTVWSGETSGSDAVTTMSVVATHTERLRVANGIIPVQTRTPHVLAMTAATLGHLAPGRVALGLGVSSRIIVGDWYGLPFERPVAQLREAVEVIRRILTGERVTFDGRFYRARGFRLAMAPPREPVRIYLAALGPRMLELAGEIADGVLLNWIAPAAVPAALARVEAGARRAGRSLADLELAAYVRTSVTDAPEPARQHLARDITGYAIVDSYARFFADSGYADEVERVNAAWRAGDRAGAVSHISPRMLEGITALGDEAACRDRFAEFARAGLTHTVVLPVSADGDPATLWRTMRTFGSGAPPSP
ncbi:MAG TPA: LLM class flavin-dependent oxidoreductase [Candidatus Binatia bacterium]|nr:LLM class flavin-dependent oxidoreductase [Candidatus Binatia bacterium]